MERWRWLPEDAGEQRVVVNIPGFWLHVVEGGSTTIEMPVVVGRESWETPLFSTSITDVVFNPRWVVPPSIAREELLPKGRQDPDYFARHGYEVRGGERLIQPPGPRNPLGHLKFLIPNPFGVYLHDAPARALFRQPVRTYSHGCVRIGNATALAARLLDDMPRWDAAHRRAVLSGWVTHTVHLRTPMPLHVTYQTAWVDEGGAVHFVDDIYGRDEELARALTRPRERPRPPVVPPVEPAPTQALVE
jgi:murein L,D-transpeptidase YcbB/YkuD